MTLKWIEAQIEEAREWDNDRDSIRDLAALIVVRDHLRASEEYVVPTAQAETKEERENRQAILLTSYSADLDTVPTIEQVENALGAITVKNAQQKERYQDAMTWKRILKGE